MAYQIPYDEYLYFWDIFKGESDEQVIERARKLTGDRIQFATRTAALAFHHGVWQRQCEANEQERQRNFQRLGRRLERYRRIARIKQRIRIFFQFPSRRSLALIFQHS